LLHDAIDSNTACYFIRRANSQREQKNWFPLESFGRAKIY
jgi:hypothetical protein